MQHVEGCTDANHNDRNAEHEHMQDHLHSNLHTQDDPNNGCNNQTSTINQAPDRIDNARDLTNDLPIQETNVEENEGKLTPAAMKNSLPRHSSGRSFTISNKERVGSGQTNYANPSESHNGRPLSSEYSYINHTHVDQHDLASVFRDTVSNYSYINSVATFQQNSYRPPNFGFYKKNNQRTAKSKFKKSQFKNHD